MKRLAKMTKATSSLRRSSAGATPSSPAGEIDTSHTITATRVPPVRFQTALPPRYAQPPASSVGHVTARRDTALQERSGASGLGTLPRALTGSQPLHHRR